MKRQLWGSFSSPNDEESTAKQIEFDQEIMNDKRGEEK
jgi:hypothetical protein